MVHPDPSTLSYVGRASGMELLDLDVEATMREHRGGVDGASGAPGGSLVYDGNVMSFTVSEQT